MAAKLNVLANADNASELLSRNQTKQLVPNLYHYPLFRLSCLAIIVLKRYPSVLAVAQTRKFCTNAACCRMGISNLEVPHNQLKYEKCKSGSGNC